MQPPYNYSSNTDNLAPQERGSGRFMVTICIGRIEAVIVLPLKTGINVNNSG